MTRQPFKSKNIKSAGYDPETGEIEVEFRKGEDVEGVFDLPQPWAIPQHLPAAEEVPYNRE
jgi:hypothetical protein